MINSVLPKLNEARQLIKEMELKKQGHNDYSNYDYFTPEQVGSMVYGACKKTKLLTTFDLLKDENGYFGALKIYDLEGTGVLEFKMATAIPDIKATNITQQIGGAMTYTERYLKMSAFDIQDNNLDPDSQDHRQESSPITSKKQTTPDSTLDSLLPKEFAKFNNGDEITINKETYAVLKGISKKNGQAYFALKNSQKKVEFYNEKNPIVLQLIMQHNEENIDINELPF